MNQYLNDFKKILFLAIYSCLVTPAAYAQTAQFLTGNKTGNIYQPGSLIGLGTRNAGIGTDECTYHRAVQYTSLLLWRPYFK